MAIIPYINKFLRKKIQSNSKKQIRNLADLALLSQGLLKGTHLTDFISRSVELMQGKKQSNIILEA